MEITTFLIVASLLGVILPVIFAFLSVFFTGIITQPKWRVGANNAIEIIIAVLSASLEVITYYHNVGDLSAFLGATNGTATLLLVFLITGFQHFKDYLRNNVMVMQDDKLHVIAPQKKAPPQTWEESLKEPIDMQLTQKWPTIPHREDKQFRNLRHFESFIPPQKEIFLNQYNEQ